MTIEGIKKLYSNIAWRNVILKQELAELEGLIDATDKADVRYNEYINEYSEKEAAKSFNDEAAHTLWNLMYEHGLSIV